MNYYIVVEGETEIEVYKSWICSRNPGLSYVNSIEEIRDNHFFILSGKGYPQYFNMIEAGIEDVRQYPHINYLVAAVDSELLYCGFLLC
ncbi:MAG: hypothetical protein JXB88_02975 [Spirochaetales bacterium]|nr:hypothetical protein [Spirochaetales bacterium]